MSINFWAVLVCAVLSIIVGGVWYGAIFGRIWMRLFKMDQVDSVTMERKKKEARKLYLIQFLLTLFQVYVLAIFLSSVSGVTAVSNSLWIYAGFVLTIIGGGVLWTGDSRRDAWTKFLIQAGYQLLMFVIFGLVLGFWK